MWPDFLDCCWRFKREMCCLSASKLTGWCFKDGVWPQTYFEKNILIVCLEMILICFQSSDRNQTENFSLTENKTESRKKNKQAAAEGLWSISGEETLVIVMGHRLEPVKGFLWSIKKNPNNPFDVSLSNYFWAWASEYKGPCTEDQSPLFNHILIASFFSQAG